VQTLSGVIYRKPLGPVKGQIFGVKWELRVSWVPPTLLARADMVIE